MKKKRDIEIQMARLEGQIHGAVIASTQWRDGLASRLDGIESRLAKVELSAKKMETPEEYHGPPKDGRYWRWAENAWFAMEKPPAPMMPGLAAAIDKENGGSGKFRDNSD